MMKKRISKPWGWEEILVEMDSYRINRIHVYAGHRTSKQYHKEKTETQILSMNKLRHIPSNTIHRLTAPSDCDLELLEVCHGSDLDAVRLEDDYGRYGNEEEKF